VLITGDEKENGKEKMSIEVNEDTRLCGLISNTSTIYT
jgi:hypothetical protein